MCMRPTLFKMTLERVKGVAQMSFCKSVFTGFFGLLLVLTFLANTGRAAVEPVKLKCEYLCDPVGIDTTCPRLSWVLRSDERAQKQSAYQLLVASSEERLQSDEGDLWDTGKVVSDKSIHVPYKGRELKSRMRCHWKVRVWDKNGKISDYSQPALWEMGLISTKDWQARWISGPSLDWDKDPGKTQSSPLFRKMFTLRKPVRRARAYISGLGYYELYLNGKKVGDNVLDPAFTRYDKRVLYVTYDITKAVAEGDNVVGAMLGNGWYNVKSRAAWGFDKAPWRAQPTLICQVEVEFVDGSMKVIASDSSWKVVSGPIRFDNIRLGEVYDARMEQAGWNGTQYNDHSWNAARVVDGPSGKLAAQMLQPIRVIETLEPVKVSEPQKGTYVFDMGQNIAGWAQLTVSGPRGTRVVMKYGERLYDNGTLDLRDVSAFVEDKELFQTDAYILSGEGTEVWEPRFTYHGFRYVQVTGFPGKPGVQNLSGRVVHTALEPVGHFECSNNLFNNIQRCTLRSFVGNFHGYPTDCPHREKNGWTDDAHIAVEVGLYNYDSAAAYTKWLKDIKDEQPQSGELPGIIPTGGWGYTWGNGYPGDLAYIWVAWSIYRYCGDRRVLEEHYEAFKRHLGFITGNQATDGIVSYGLGDWNSVKGSTPTPAPVISTGCYYREAFLLSKIAELLGKDDDVQLYSQLATEIKQAFDKKFFNPETSVYADGTQGGLSLALHYGLVEPEKKRGTMKALLASIENSKYHLTTGITGTMCLLNAMTDNSQIGLAYRIANQKTFPGWGYWIDQGATTLWEQWDGTESRNHIMFGYISAWFYKAIGGINLDRKEAGFKKIVIRPFGANGLAWARAEHRSMYGLIRSAWQKKPDNFILEVTTPVNTTAIVHIPAKTARAVTEGGMLAEKSLGVSFLRMDGEAAVFVVESGDYSFVSRQ